VPSTDLDVLFPHLGGVVVERLYRTTDGVVFEARPVAVTGICPGCGTSSARVHGRYQRRLTDLAVSGLPVVIRLEMLRFACRVASCPRVTFAGQIDGLTSAHSRFSPPLRAALAAIAKALAGRPGARLARALGITVGRDTLLGLLRRLPDPDIGEVRILGVDDFALRKGHVYGSILLDMSTHRPVDVLPDREAATLADWLRAHPGVRVICRDRAGAYAEGARAGAPDADQVADRWHLWHNLCEAVHRIVVKHRACLPEPTPDPTTEPTGSNEQAPAPATQRAETPATILLRERYATVKQLLDTGIQRKVIAARLGLHPDTIARYADATSIDDLLISKSRASKLDPFKDYLDARWNAGCTDATRLTTELHAQGYQGTARTVRRYLEPLRESGSPACHTATPPKPRQVTGWLTRHPDQVSPEKKTRLKAVLDRCPQLHTLAGLVADFADILCHRRGHQLTAWLDTAEATDLPDLHTFTAGLRRDLVAVTNGLTLPWSSGAVEGTVCKIKYIKRSMFGRANFDLLRKRVLASG
jgi:transposase